MVSTILVFMGLHFFSISGFLLDSTKSPQAENGISESHFTTLLKLLVDERKSREQLENVVLRLQQELSNKVSSSDHCNCKSAEITEELNNNTEQLKTELGYLRKEFDTLQLQCGQFDKHVSSNRAYTERPTQGTGDLKELKGTADLETILGLENKTNHLEVKVYNMELSLQSIVSGANARSKKLIGIVNKIKATDNLTLYLTNEIQKSNGKLSAVMTDMNSRKQDFIALVNKTEFTNDKLRSLEIWLENKIHYLETNFTLSVSNITNTVNQSLTSLQKYFMNSVQHLQSGLNDTYQKLDKISNRAVLSAYANGGTIAANVVIPFTQIHALRGIQNFTSVMKEGKFTCEISGMYLISVFVSTDTNSSGNFKIYRNNRIIATAFRQPHLNYLTFTAIVPERLHINDSVFVKNGPEMVVGNIGQSSFSIIQI